MPYAGVWAGFCFVDSNDAEGECITQITNGIIEKHWSYRKANQLHKVQTPINYANNSYLKTRGQALLFMKQIKGVVISDSHNDTGSDMDIDVLDVENYANLEKEKKVSCNN